MGNRYKVMRLLSIILTLSVVFTGCDSENAFDCFKSAGDNGEISYLTDAFDFIEVNDGLNVTLVQGPEHSVKVSGGENLLSKVRVDVSNGLLILSDDNTCNWVRNYREMEVEVTSPDLTQVKQFGYGRIATQGVWVLDEFKAEAKNGTGDFSLEVDCNRLIIVSNTISNFKVKGSTDLLTVGFFFNDGKFLGRELNTPNAQIEHLGSNVIEVSPSVELSGRIRRSGDVVYYGSPDIIDVEITGDGRLIAR